MPVTIGLFDVDIAANLFFGTLLKSDFSTSVCTDVKKCKKVGKNYFLLPKGLL